ncbi:PAP/OAS1 SUBSTRATE-BINDING DOMAIN SUPERFAMILY [Salix purpurea]|uniref:PAP/OAS1 SUBSTRATE-BINDING DOMAIN SUPERFAMILY n=1 Tax=Salix purpurea TaxID=77065 RepID=A0A9Q0PDY3_SALPP|nr:PAP/OAS1 SUBSTRATE-BINDING DOMAIN SUPERFAMILY [Salix purpurea]
MGEHEGWAQPPSGLSPNGLLPNEAPSVIRVLNSERWSKAEERTAELIACIQPNQHSEELRNAVADYVKRLIAKCFPCQVFTFGSVPLKTYLPDGDIDLTAFSKNPNLKDTWAHQVRDMLENEEKNESASFRVKEVQYIQAEVKIIKCLVENIVVDISFNQLGGLCTLCFLEEVDNLINQNHLFKRSIILIKAWCYYESRILGAHHGLISTYALETLVLYIFHVFNNSFAGPLEVLYRFLEFFNVTAEPPRKDGGELLLSKLFLEACSAVYAVSPAGQDNQGQPFLSKYFNVIDPLRVNNNLGRSVSKGNFFRIRSAFAFGAKRLARLLDCPKEDLCIEVNQFFLNTWERHGSGHRPDVPRNDLWRLRLSNHDHLCGPESLRNNPSSKPSGHEVQVDVARGSCSVPSQLDNYSLDSTSKGSEVSTLSCTQSQKTNANTNSTRTTSEQSRRESTSNQSMHADKIQRNTNPDNLVTDFQGRYLFARTCSSPELTEKYREISSQGRRNKVQESGKDQASSARHTSSQSCNPAADSNSYHKDFDLDVADEEFVSVLVSQGMHQEEQDLVNVMASSTGLGFKEQVHVPLNMVPSHISLPIPPSVLASVGYDQRNIGGIVPTNIPFLETPWGSNMQPLTHYFPGIELTSNQEDSIEPGNDNFGPVEMNVREPDHDFWHEQERGSTSGFDIENGSFETHQLDDPQPGSSSYKFVSSSRRGGSGNSLRAHKKLTRETRGAAREESIGALTYQENRGTEEYFDDRSACSRSFITENTSPLRSKTSSESSWEGSLAKLKPVKEKRGRKMVSSAVQSSVYGKGKGASEHSSILTDDDSKEWNALSTMGPEPERSIGSQTEISAALHVSMNQVPGYERAQPSESDSLIPIAPVLLGPVSRQRSADNSGSGTVPFTFYPAGPPVPFVAMLPPYNFPTETGTSGDIN